MPGVRVEIVRFVDAHQPGWVECELVEANGRIVRFVEKVPIVSARDLDEHSAYPAVGEIACVELERRSEGARGSVVTISTAPDSVESTDGRSQFEVFASQLTDAAGS